MNKRIVSIVIISLFIATTAYFLRANITLKESARNERIEFDKRMESECVNIRVEIRKDLEEKYRADIISYQAMIKRLELEKKRMRALEKEIEELKR